LLIEEEMKKLKFGRNFSEKTAVHPRTAPRKRKRPSRAKAGAGPGQPPNGQ
jgi:hypothetical protein